jgi:Flp pilus assembly protein TadD
MTMPRGIAAALLLALTGCLCAAASADEIDDAGKLLRQGNVAAAEQRVDALLQKSPKSARARFLKGMVLTERRQTTEAIALYTAMTEDFPELPEPYNNLAVLFAGQGQFDRAREALEAAVRARPDFPTAHENLGDIYTRMAARSYEQAVRLDRENDGARVKLRLANELLTHRASAQAAPRGR